LILNEIKVCKKLAFVFIHAWSTFSRFGSLESLSKILINFHKIKSSAIQIKQSILLTTASTASSHE